MSENERMDRAKRIRQMREGNRNGDESDDETTTDETDEQPADPAQTEQPATESASADGGTAAVTEKPAETDDADEAAETEAATEADDGSTASGTSAPLPDAEQLEQALDDSDAETVTPEEATAEDAAGAGAVAEEEAAEEEEETRVLEFSLDGEHYCLEIQYIEEIVKQDAITRVPNTPEFVEGVVDLRGQITTILNPKVTIDKENKDSGDLIVVFDSEAFEDQGHIGWVVDDVRQVSPILESEVNDPPMEEEYINGVIDREDDDQFVIWTSPDMAFDEQDESDERERASA